MAFSFQSLETFEKRSILFKFKSKIPDLDPGEDDNFNHRHTWSISRINPPKFGGGLKFESDTGIGQKGMFFKAIKALTSIERKPMMPHMQDGKGEAVVSYREPFSTQQMGHHRLSRRVNKMMKKI